MSATKKPEFEHVDYMDATSYSFDSPIAMSRMARKQHAIKLLEEPDVIPMHIEVANEPSAQFYNFSDEVLVKIFANLWPKELMHIRLVCRRFLELSSDDYLWYNMVKRHVRMIEQERLRGRMKQEEQEKKQEDRPARNQDEKADPSEDSKKPPAKKEKKVRRRTQLDNLKPKDRDWKWVYLSKHTKFSQPCEDKVTGLGQYTWGGGSYYEGEWHEGKPHGKGIKFWEDNEYYLGDWKEGKMDGYGEYHWPDGAVYIGQWKDGYHDGEGLYIWEDGNQYNGSWKLGERDGYGVRTWVDGDVFKGDWVKGKRTGYGTYHWPNGSQFEGQWKNGCHHGVGTYTWLDGRKYTGEWEESKKHGKGVYDFGDGCVFEGEWRTGHRHGAGVMVWSDGTKFMGRYEKDKRNTLHGVCFDRDGNPQPGDWLGTRPYDHYFVEDEEVWEIKYRSNISRRRMQALVALKEKNKGKLPEPIREDKVLDPES